MDIFIPALTILATVSDIIDTISVDDIVTIAQCSLRLREHRM